MYRTEAVTEEEYNLFIAVFTDNNMTTTTGYTFSLEEYRGNSAVVGYGPRGWEFYAYKDNSFGDISWSIADGEEDWRYNLSIEDALYWAPHLNELL